jgi:hypothetical protein
METVSTDLVHERNQVFERSKENFLSYQGYRACIAALHEKKQVTGHEQSESLLNYSLLNEQRMNRWDKHYTPSPAMVAAIEAMPAHWNVVVIAEGWCGDAAQIVPALHAIVQLRKDWQFNVVLRDENPDWMNLYLTNGAKSIPIAVVFDDKGKYRFHWGPRPLEAIALVVDAKRNEIPAEQWKNDLHKWYAFNKQMALEAEWIALFESQP